MELQTGWGAERSLPSIFEKRQIAHTLKLH